MRSSLRVSRRILPAALGVALAIVLVACGGGGDDEKPEPLGMLDFRPTAEFGLDATILALQLGKEVVDARAGDDSMARAEGYRYLLRQIEMHQSMFTADQDALHPGVQRCPTKNCRLGFDSPDYTYVGVAPLSAEVNYRLYGTRGNSDVVLLQVLERSDGPFKGTSRTSFQDMEFAEDGSWEIFLGAKRPAGVSEANFLELKEDNAQMVIRIAHGDWNNSFEPSFQVEVLDTVPVEVESFTPTRMAMTGFALSKVIPNQLHRWIKRLEDAPLNAAEKPCTAWGNRCEGEGGFGNWSTGGRYLLDEDEVLIIEADYMPLVFQNIQLGNIWAESQDYGNKQTSLNGHQAYRDADGKYRYVLAHRDPGVPNWLDISDHPQGSFFMRWVYPENDAVPTQPKSKVVPFQELRQYLPDDTPVVTPAQRAEVLKLRALGYQRRMNPGGLLPPGKSDPDEGIEKG